jgi:hypothetical protein
MNLTLAQLRKMPGVDPAALPPAEKRRHKYSAQRTECDGHIFASKREANRYGELKLLESASRISCLELQPKYDLHEPGGKIVGRYFADFRYLDLETGETVIEDVKGFRTRRYLAKKRHVEAEYNIQIMEVR